MDSLHGVLRSIRAETKSDARHLTVFREFLAHLDRVQRKAPSKPLRVKPIARKKRPKPPR
jgi:hypothetical protein